MKKLLLVGLIFSLLYLIACTKTPIGSTALKENIEMLRKQTNVSVFQTLELQTQTENTVRYNVTKFTVSGNGNYELYEQKTGKTNGVENANWKDDTYMYLSDGDYNLFNSKISKHQIEYTNWCEFTFLNYIFLAVADGFDSSDDLYQINSGNLHDFIFYHLFRDLGSSYSRSVLENKHVTLEAKVPENKIGLNMVLDLSSLLNAYTVKQYSVIRFIISIAINEAAFTKPVWITEADDYKVDIGNRAYPHMDGNPDSVVVKHIDVSKHDTRGEGDPSFTAEQDKGESTYIKIGDIDILIDAGNNNNNNASVKAIKEVIDGNSNDKILDYVIVTHPHADHYGGMSEIINSYQVKMFIETSGTYTGYMWESYKSLRERKAVEYSSDVCFYTDLLSNKSEECQNTMFVADSVSMNFLDTGFAESSSANPSSIVFVLNAFGIKYLFQGDAENAQENNYALSAGKIDIMKMPHHGTAYATYEYFLKTCKPNNIIVQNGNNLGNQYGHPTATTINRIYSIDSSINIYPVTGGGFGNTCKYLSNGEKTCSPEDPENTFRAFFDPNRFLERNGIITTTITNQGYSITSELPTIMEMSKTQYWLTHNKAQYYHA